jgi:macrolide transport system ATP-binding/permease protein
LTDHIHISGVSHGYGDRLLLDNIDLVVSAGEHVVIIGENGAGKSTLLRLMAGAEQPDSGSVAVHGRVAHLAQVLDAPPEATVGEVIDAALTAFRDMEARLHQLEAAMAADGETVLDEYGRLLTEFQLRGGYEADARVDAAMDQLGLRHIGRGRHLGSLSGGEQERLALACILADPASILLLDEPTNHLDAGGAEWLEGKLAAHPGAVVAISHDRTFLRRVAATVVEVDAERRSVKRYGNGYGGYLARKAAERCRWVQEYEQWQDAMEAERTKAATTARNLAYGRRRDGDKMAYGLKGGTLQDAVSSRIRNAQERLRRLQENPVDRPPEPLALRARLGGRRLHGTVLSAYDVVVPGRLELPALEVAAGQKLLITGPNGAGKTTLLDVLAGIREPQHGTVTRRGRLGYLPQELPAPARPARRLLPAFAAGLGDAGPVGDLERHAERLLALGLFRAADFQVPVGALSAGQYRRLVLARLLVGNHDVLVFDEPTNHLAPLLVEELEELFAAYQGTLVMVSHDRALRQWFSTLEGRELSVAKGKLLPAAPAAL